MLRTVIVSLLVSLFLSYALVVVFLMFGPVYVNGELAMQQSGPWTLLTLAVVFWPVFFFFRKRRSPK